MKLKLMCSAFISSVLQPNSPAAMVQTALRSANKTRLVRVQPYSLICRRTYIALFNLDNLFFPTVYTHVPSFLPQQLARRLFYSFRRPGMDGITIEDIARFYPTIEDAEVAFSLFDKDQNGDVSRDEIEMSCL